MKENCEHCGRAFCFCDHKKYKAKIVIHVQGRDKKESNERLDKIRAYIERMPKGASCITYELAVRENRYAEDIKAEIVNNFVSLALAYNWDHEKIQDWIDGTLFDEVSEAIDTEIAADQADRAYDEMKERQAFGED